MDNDENMSLNKVIRLWVGAFVLPAILLLSSWAKDNSLAMVADSHESKPVHLAIIGASISAGLFSGTSMAQVLEAAIGQPKRITDRSATWFYSDPPGYAKRMIRQLQQDRPSIVLALDYLFWFGYGPKTFGYRKKQIQQALELLDTLKCRVIVGDLPALSASMLLRQKEIPSTKELQDLNKLIRKWGIRNPRATIFPLAALTRSVQNRQRIEINASPWRFNKQQMLQFDGLHLTRNGLIAVTAIVLEELKRACPVLDKNTTLTDPTAISARLLKMKKRPQPLLNTSRR